MVNNGKYGVIDLFTGPGGLSLGFKRAGFKIVGGVEQNEFAAAFCGWVYEEGVGMYCRLDNPSKCCDYPPNWWMTDHNALAEGKAKLPRWEIIKYDVDDYVASVMNPDDGEVYNSDNEETESLAFWGACYEMMMKGK